MQDYNKTVVTIFDSNFAPSTIQLSGFNKNVIYFGRDQKNDIVLSSSLVSREHGRFVCKGDSWVIEDRSAYQGIASTNGMTCNNAPIVSHVIRDGDFVRIDNDAETVSEGVLFVFSSADSNNTWSFVPLFGRQALTIGRERGCNIALSHISVSRMHAKILREGREWYIMDNDSKNGVIVNGNRISEKTKLHEKDVITITNSKLIFTPAMIFCCLYRSDALEGTSSIVVKRGKGMKFFVHHSPERKPGRRTAKMRCVYCGGALPSAGNFCPYCGRPQMPRADVPPEQEATTDKRNGAEKSGGKKWLNILKIRVRP